MNIKIENKNISIYLQDPKQEMALFFSLYTLKYHSWPVLTKKILLLHNFLTKD